MLITYKGRKSGKRFTTPVRYIRVDDVVRCFTSTDTLWWRNLRGGAEVVLQLQDQQKRYHARVFESKPEQTRAALEHYLALYPQDAGYYDIRLNKDKSLNCEDFERALTGIIVVEASPL